MRPITIEKKDPHFGAVRLFDVEVLRTRVFWPSAPNCPPIELHTSCKTFSFMTDVASCSQSVACPNKNRHWHHLWCAPEMICIGSGSAFIWFDTWRIQLSVPRAEGVCDGVQKGSLSTWFNCFCRVALFSFKNFSSYSSVPLVNLSNKVYSGDFPDFIMFSANWP